MKETDRRATRRYVALGAGIGPDCSVLRGKEKSKMSETDESREERRN